MKLESHLITEIADKQFEMIGETIRFKDIPSDELIVVGKKKVFWYDHYKFTEEQEEEWREWMLKQIVGTPYSKKGSYIELRYGFIREIKKEGL